MKAKRRFCDKFLDWLIKFSFSMGNFPFENKEIVFWWSVSSCVWVSVYGMYMYGPRVYGASNEWYQRSKCGFNWLARDENISNYIRSIGTHPPCPLLYIQWLIAMLFVISSVLVFISFELNIDPFCSANSNLTHAFFLHAINTILYCLYIFGKVSNCY